MNARKVIFWGHLIVGVVLGAGILIISVTGTILAFRPQIVAYAERNIRTVTPQASGERLSLKDIVAKAQDKAPGDAKVRGVTIKSDAQASTTVSFGRDGMVHVNPYTGEILGGESQASAFLEKVEVWHRWLGMEGDLKPAGQLIKKICTIAFLLMIISGFYLWWPRSWRWNTLKQVITFNPHVTGKARNWNWHNVIGFWCAPFLLIIIGTGLIMIFSEGMGKVNPASRREKTQTQEHGKAVDLDTVLTKAQEQVPGWVSINIRLPRQGAPFNVMIEEPGPGFVHPRSQLSLDASTGDVIKWEPASQQSEDRKFRFWARWAHTGEAGGIVGQILAFLATAGAVVLVWTGFCMAWERFIQFRRRSHV